MNGSFEIEVAQLRGVLPPIPMVGFGRNLTRMGVDSFKSSAMQRCGIRLRAREVS